MNPLDPENNCRSYFTFKAFLEFFTPHGPTRQALQLHPTHQREGDRAPPHTLTSIRGPPILRRAMPPFSPTHQWVFSLFFSSHSTSPPPTSSSACTRSTKAKPPLTPAKPISPPTSPIHCSHAAGKTLLSNPPSTIRDGKMNPTRGYPAWPDPFNIRVRSGFSLKKNPKRVRVGSGY